MGSVFACKVMENQPNQFVSQPNASLKLSRAVLISIIVTALLVGLGVYTWQRSVAQTSEAALQQQIETLQKEIASLPSATVVPGTSLYLNSLPGILQQIVSLSEAAHWDTWRHVAAEEMGQLFENVLDTPVSGIYVTSQETGFGLDTVRSQIDSVLLAEGWKADPKLDADGISGSVWGYRDRVGDQQHVLIFRWSSRVLHPATNEPPQCPCLYINEIFLSDSDLEQEILLALEESNPTLKEYPVAVTIVGTSGNFVRFGTAFQPGVELDPAFGFAEKVSGKWKIINYGTGGDPTEFYRQYNIPKELQGSGY